MHNPHFVPDRVADRLTAPPLESFYSYTYALPAPLYQRAFWALERAGDAAGRAFWRRWYALCQAMQSIPKALRVEYSYYRLLLYGWVTMALSFIQGPRLFD